MYEKCLIIKINKLLSVTLFALVPILYIISTKVNLVADFDYHNLELVISGLPIF